MKAKIYAYLMLIFLLFICCVKNEKPVSNTNLTNSGLINGGFIYYQNVNNNVPSITNTTVIQVLCCFFNPAVNPNASYLNGSYCKDVGSVKINSITLQKDFVIPGSPQYIDSTNSLNSLPLNISIGGSSNFTPTSFVDNGSFFPHFSNMNQIPNSISKSAGFTFTLANLVNTTVTAVSIGSISQSFMGNVISFSPAQLSALNTSTFSTLIINCSQGSQNTFTQGGKNYLSSNTLIYTKQGISITP